MVIRLVAANGVELYAAEIIVSLMLSRIPDVK